MWSKITILMFWLMLTAPISAQNQKPSVAKTLPDELENIPINLLDERLSHWYKWLGVPYRGITGLPTGTPIGDDLHGTPIGRQDPKAVFKMVTLDGERVLNVSGEI